MPAGRISQLNDPDFARQVAELYIRGVPHAQMAEELMCSASSISVWVKDPRVVAHAKRMAIERVNLIVRRLDGELEARLAHVDDWDLQDLLKVRREMLDRPLKTLGEDSIDTGKVTNEITEAMDQNPDFATALRKLMDG